jgi:hypothetical protein
MIQKEFIPYEEALALKELGFDGKNCMRFYNPELSLVNTFLHSGNIGAPLYQQAFRWFREKYNINGEVRLYQEYQKDNYAYSLVFTKNSTYLNEEGNKVGQIISRMYKDTYEEAELACLRKLIEIVKQ